MANEMLKDNPKKIDSNIKNPILSYAVKVSIVIPIYNAELYIVECLESVIGQTLKEIEIVCVDDGSTDTSKSIVEKYVKLDNRVKLICKNNEGVSAARNDGVREASGRYIFFVDSDDYIESNALEMLYNAAEYDNLDLVVIGAKAFCDDKNANPEEREFLRKRTVSVNNWLCRDAVYENRIISGQEFLASMSRNKQYVSMSWSLFAKRSFYLSNKLEFPVGKIHEDEYFTFNKLICASRMKFINLVLYRYRIRTGSIMTKLDMEKSIKSLIYIYVDLLKYLSNSIVDKSLILDVMKVVQRLANTAYTRFNTLCADEKVALLDDLNITERVLFSQVIDLKTSFARVDELKGERKNDAVKLDRLVKKLDLTNADLNASKKELEIIRKQLNTTNEDFKNTKNLLGNANIKLESTQNQLNNTTVKLKHVQKKLNDVRNGMSYKIGRIITFIPRKLLGRP